MTGVISRNDLDAGRVDLSEVTTGKRIPRVHPGKILKREFLDPLGVTAYKLAKDIGVPSNRVTGILAGNRVLTEDTAIRLGLYFNMSPQFWLNLQVSYNLEDAHQKNGAKIRKTVKPFALATAV